MKLARYIIGLISGFTFGMLFAPKKGQELRDEILKKGKASGAEGLKVLGDAFKGAGKEAYKEFKTLSEHEQVAAFLELSNEKIKGFLQTAEEKGYDVAATLQDKMEYVKDFVKYKTGSCGCCCEDKENPDNVKKPVPARSNPPFKKRKAVKKKGGGKKVGKNVK